MQLVCSTLGFDGDALHEALSHLALMGCQALELIVTSRPQGLELLDWRSLGELQDTLEGNHLRVASLDAGYRPRGTPTDWLRHARAAVDLARDLGAPVVAVHPGPWDDRRLDEVFPWLLGHAERRGVGISLVAAASPWSDPGTLREWLDRQPASLVGLTLDLGELVARELDPRAPLEVLGDRLWSLRVPASSLTRADMPGVVATLHGQGFRGALSITSDGADEAPHRQAYRTLRALRPILAALDPGMRAGKGD